MSLLPSCKDVSRLLSESMDAGRPLGLHARVHLRICDVCRRLRAQFSFLRAAARSPESGPGLSEAAKERLRSKLK